MRFFLLMAAALFAPVAQAQIYKWVDEKGVTHYGETAPPDSKASKVDVPASPPASAKTATPQDWSKKEVEFRKRQLDRQAAEKAEEQEKLQRERECGRARQQLAFESSPGRHWRANDKGEKVYLTDDQQAAVVDAARKRVEDTCR